MAVVNTFHLFLRYYVSKRTLVFIFSHWSQDFQVCNSLWSQGEFCHKLQSKKQPGYHRATSAWWLNSNMQVDSTHMQVSNSRSNLWLSFCADISWPKPCFYSHMDKFEVTPLLHSITYDITALYVNERHAAIASPPATPPPSGVPPS